MFLNLTRGLLEERIHIELHLKLAHIEIVDVFLDGGAALDALARLLVRIVGISSFLIHMEFNRYWY